MYRSRTGLLPADVDLFGMNAANDDFDDSDGLFASSTPVEEENPEQEVPDTEEDDDEIDDLFG